jgi:NAD(P)-dependent dehydrogenase (short-subunit alcohol dehydrogenase family)
LQTAINSFGKLDILVNNAGISDPDLFEDLTLENFRWARGTPLLARPCS